MALADVYPDSLLVSSLPGFSSGRDFMGTLFYLQEHGMIAGGDIREPGRCRSMVDAQITKEGIDFLADDDGLQTILGRVRIRFDKGELVAMVDDALQKGEIGHARREVIVTSLYSMTPEALKKVIERFLAETIADNHERLSTLLFDK